MPSPQATCLYQLLTGKKQSHTYGLIKVVVLDWYDDWMVHSSSWETKVPAVVMLKEMQRRRGRPRFSKTNLYIRDLYTCQYCNTPYIRKELTMDHVLPLSRGGKTTWENMVAACGPCNTMKGNKTNMIGNHLATVVIFPTVEGHSTTKIINYKEENTL